MTTSVDSKNFLITIEKIVNSIIVDYRINFER